MAVHVTKDEPRCKLCSHDRCVEIDALLERRANGVPDAITDRKLTVDFTLELLRNRFQVPNPTKENLFGHIKKHRRFDTEVEAQKVAAFERDVALKLAEKYEQEGLKGVDSYARRAVEVAEHRMLRELRSGKLPSISMEQALKAVDTTTRRKQSDAQGQMLQALMSGVGNAMGTKMLESSPGNPESPDVVEGEVIREIDDTREGSGD